MGAFVERHDLGQVFAQDAGFKIERDPDTVRAPDVAFVAREPLSTVQPDGELNGEDVLSGFRCPLRDIL